MTPPPPVTHESTNPERARWFAEEVHSHDSALKCYLRNSFPGVKDVDDVVQESYISIWKYRPTGPIRSAKGLLFKIAERVALGFLRSSRRSPIQSVGNLEAMDTLEDKPTAVESLCKEEKIQLLVRAIDGLLARCREVIILRKLKLLPQREVAERLGISEKGVEIQLARGLARCRAFLRKKGLTHFTHDAY